MEDLDEFFSQNLVPAGIGQQQAAIHLRSMQSGSFLKIGVPGLDNRIRLVPSEFVMIGGRAGSGKTAMGMQIVDAALKTIHRRDERTSVAVFSAEMSASALMIREAAAVANVPVESLVLGRAEPEQYAAVNEALICNSYDYRDNLYIDESPSPTLEHMVEQLSSLNQASPLRLVLFDYMELAGEFGQNQVERIVKISKGLKAIAKRFQVPVVALAQLNRDIEKRPDKKVYLSDFMYGGEQSCDIAIGLLRPSFYDQAKDPRLVEAHIVKYRNGRNNSIENLTFDERTLRFDSALVVRKRLE